MDPLGFALENYKRPSASGGRTTPGCRSTQTGVLPDGTKFQGPAEFRTALLAHRDEFVTAAVTEKLLTYAPWTRGLVPSDMPVVRQVKARRGGGRLSPGRPSFLAIARRCAVPECEVRSRPENAPGPYEGSMTMFAMKTPISRGGRCSAGSGRRFALPLLDGMGAGTDRDQPHRCESSAPSRRGLRAERHETWNQWKPRDAGDGPSS